MRCYSDMIVLCASSLALATAQCPAPAPSTSRDIVITSTSNSGWNAGSTKEFGSVTAYVSAPTGCKFRVVLKNRAYPATLKRSNTCEANTDLTCCQFSTINDEVGTDRLNYIAFETGLAGADCAVKYDVHVNEVDYNGCQSGGFTGPEGTVVKVSIPSTGSYTAPIMDSATSVKINSEATKFNYGLKTVLKATRKSDDAVIVYSSATSPVTCDGLMCCKLTSDSFLNLDHTLYKDFKVVITCTNALTSNCEARLQVLQPNADANSA